MPVPERVDHLVYASPDLEVGIRAIEELLSVKAIPGGQHPSFGTQNALVSLGPSSSLEIIGPDPEQPAPARRPFGIDGLEAPRLVTWAVARGNLEREVEAARERGLDLGAVFDASRRLPNGATLSWRLTDLRVMPADGVVPFLIDWGDSPHPASMLPPSCTLLELRAAHPEPTVVRDQLAALRIDMRVDAAAEPSLTAVIRTPRGTIELT